MPYNARIWNKAIQFVFLRADSSTDFVSRLRLHLEHRINQGSNQNGGEPFFHLFRLKEFHHTLTSVHMNNSNAFQTFVQQCLTMEKQLVDQYEQVAQQQQNDHQEPNIATTNPYDENNQKRFQKFVSLRQEISTMKDVVAKMEKKMEQLQLCSQVSQNLDGKPSVNDFL